VIVAAVLVWAARSLVERSQPETEIIEAGTA
jgi:hypothetical protein